MDHLILGIDYGSTNIGLAFGREGLVSPLKVISGKNMMTAVHEINKYAIENKITKFVVGLPLSAAKKETLQSKKVRQFGNLLKATSKRPIDYFDEYNSSNEALDEAIASGVSQKNRRKIDQYSASLILKDYYQSRPV